MAISKILYMKDCGGHFHGKHLKRSLEYVMNPEKTQNGRLIGGVNCQPEHAFEQMKETKRTFGKIDKRQGYHLILSFKENEVSPDTAFEMTGKFVQQYLGKEYEAVYTVHDNTNHVHAHIIFNSVSFMKGKKYRYEKGDWAKKIQPITNRLCEEYGLSVIEITDEKAKSSEYYRDWEGQEKQSSWSEMIKRDLDACVIQASTYDSFLHLLKSKGYEVKQGKYLAIKPPGMTRFRRCKTIGSEYSEERIRERIFTEDLSFYQKQKEECSPRIVKFHVKRYRRAKMSGLQKRYYAKLYRTGRLKKRPYSQVWKYRDEIRKMQKFQNQYLFLVRHEIQNLEELTAVLQNLTVKRKEVSAEKSKVYRSRRKCSSIFAIAEKLDELQAAENAYESGDNFFAEEHAEWISLMEQLKQEGYSLEEVKYLKDFYKEQVASVCEKERAVFQELNAAKGIWEECISDGYEKNVQKEQIREEKTERREQKQPIR